ncbi:MAG: 3-dehydroquinate synthase [bacterium]|nr:3-dehydroquinate synthase [bacterium]
MKYIDTNNCRLEIGDITTSSLDEKLNFTYAHVKKVVIVDENSRENCLEYMLTNFTGLSEAEIILLPAGEDNKQLNIVGSVWEALTEYGVSRHDVIINLGGGMITDLGGFVASCYKRGLDFINIPTTLLSMVDASIGGKTGVNLGHYKNQIGVFSDPVAVYIDPVFLSTLPGYELLSGYAEMLKHGLIHSEALFSSVLQAMREDEIPSLDLIESCIRVKHEVVTEDPTEKGKRKVLNLGHTIGHVLEGHFMNRIPLTHGHCVAIGIMMEAYISYRRGMLAEEDFRLVQDAIFEFYELPAYSNDEVGEMVAMLYNDKKNANNAILCVLLQKIGDCSYDIEVPESQFVEAFLHYKNLQINMN